MGKPTRAVYVIPDLFPSLSRVPNITCPFLVVHGDRDNLIPVDHARRLHAAAYPNARLEIIHGADHNDVEYVGGEAYDEMITRFLQNTAQKTVG